MNKEDRHQPGALVYYRFAAPPEYGVVVSQNDDGTYAVLYFDGLMVPRTEHGEIRPYFVGRKR